MYKHKNIALSFSDEEKYHSFSIEYACNLQSWFMLNVSQIWIHISDFLLVLILLKQLLCNCVRFVRALRARYYYFVVDKGHTRQDTRFKGTSINYCIT